MDSARLSPVVESEAAAPPEAGSPPQESQRQESRFLRALAGLRRHETQRLRPVLPQQQRE